jgi:hypothetical protein
MREMHLTNGGGGEKLSRFEGFGPGDLEVGDRIYGNIPGIEHVKKSGSGFVLRLRAERSRCIMGRGGR